MSAAQTVTPDSQRRVLLRAIASKRAPALGRRRPPAGADWGVIVDRCVRSWVAAEASVRAFLDEWSPLALFTVGTPAPVRHRSARRRSRRPRPHPARRPPHRPAPTPDDADLGRIIFDGLEPAALRRRFPYVAELLIELSATPPVAGRTGTRRP